MTPYAVKIGHQTRGGLVVKLVNASVTGHGAVPGLTQNLNFAFDTMQNNSRQTLGGPRDPT